MTDLRLVHNVEAGRYEAWFADELAGFAQYALVGDLVQIPHTEVADAFGGRGVGSAIARFALDDVRASGQRVVPLCPFIRGWIDRHPDYADLVFHSAH